MTQPVEDTRIQVSVVVPVKNEERNIQRCLEGLGRFAQVIVVDSGSSDDTAAIARRNGAEVLQFVWNGSYPKKRNWLLINHPPRCPWVLFLDADEVVDDAFCDAVAKATADARFNGYWLNYTIHFLGRELRFGVPQKKLALFRVSHGLYERIDERGWSKLDMEIHEHPVVDGAVGVIDTPIEHRDYQGLGKFIDRHRDYAQWEARRFLLLAEQAGGRADGSSSTMTRRQSFKYSHLDRWWYAPAYFLFAYGAKRGFLDGAAGFYYAFYKAWYFLTIRLLIKEAR